MKNNQFSRLKIGVAPVVMGFALVSTAAYAQAEQAAPADEEYKDMIVVTGSRIARPDFSNPNPVVTVDAATIEQSGQINLTEFLADNPALLGSQKNIDSGGANLQNGQLVGVNLLNLRNLGTARTLVLVDGKRHVAGFPGTASVDINTIPTDLVERVDILTGGVSAIYGADGVSGVVNFILKQDFEGLRIRAQNGISQRGDAGERFIAATAGKNFSDGRGNVTLAYEFNETDRFSHKQRLNYGLSGPTWGLVRNPGDGTPGTAGDDPNVPDRILIKDLRWANSSPGGAIDFTGDGLPDFTGAGKPYDLGSFVPGTSFTVGGDSTPRESYYGDYTPYTRRHIANMMASYAFSPAVKFHAELKYVKSKAWTKSQPVFDLYTGLAPDNAFLIERFGPALASNSALFSRDNFDFGQRRYELDRELWRGVAAVTGNLTPHLNYDASFVFGQSTQQATTNGDRITDRYYAALDTVYDVNGNKTCRINLPGQTDIFGFSFGNPKSYSGPPVTFQKGECVPLNILGEGSPSKEALAFVLANHSNYARLRQYVANVTLSGDTGAFFNLPGGPVAFAAGAEYRKETSYSRPSQFRMDDALLDSSAAQIENGRYDVKEVYGEIRLPLLADAPFAKDLSVGGALRISDYSTVGTTTTWNLNASYVPVRDIALRATYSKSVRAPNITELFAPLSGSFELITDPCGIDRVAEGKAPRPANCVAALTALGIDPATFDPANSGLSPQNSGLLGNQGGNPDLNAEKATTWTAGTILRPRFLPGFTMSVDWYDIKLTQAIQYSTAQDITDLCYDQPTLDNPYCELISRSNTTGFVNSFQVVPQNVASFRTAGLDMNMQYRLHLGEKAGLLDLRLVGNYLDKLSFVPSLGAQAQNDLGNASYPAPRWSAAFDVTWHKGPFTFNYGLNWWDKTRRVTPEQIAANPDYVPSQYYNYREKWEHEIYASYDVDDKFQFYGGINNLFDRKPDDGAIGYPVNAVGRYFFAGVKAKIF